MDLEQKFWSRVNRGDNDECWEWTGSQTKGYGNLTHKSQTLYAHRVAYRLEHGDVPDGAHVLHECHNKSCVNPAHLKLGNHTDNMRDARQQGKAHHQLDAETALAVKSDYAETSMTQQQVADKHDISQSLVSLVVNEKIWSDIDND